ncbi:MAG: Ig-like domain-containing protein [Oscillospiraceae bacterium]|nr:Ig-like domain-containing protein [Oscillospiraceae bacterium]
MKKILSIILCAALIIGMLPAVFATTTGEETDTLEYVFSVEAVGGASRKDSIAQWNTVNQTYDAIVNTISKNKWAYVDINKQKASQLEKGSFHYAVVSGRCSEGATGIALKINVPEGAGGIYKPEISYFEHPNGGKMSVYIVPVSAAQTTWSPICTSVIADSKNAATQVKKIVDGENTYNANAIATDSYDAAKIVTVPESQTLELSAGDYYLVFTIVGYSEDAVPFTNGKGEEIYYIHPIGLKLTKLTPASVEVSADATEIDAGGTTKLTSVVKTANGTEIPAKVNYSSSNSIVTVDENGNVTAGNTAGKVTITATVDGTTVSDSVEITVTKSYNYAFSGTATTGDWSQAAASYGLVSATIKNSWIYLANQIDTEGNHTLNVAPFKMSFAEKGIYKPTITVAPYVGGGIVSVYLAPATWIESKNLFNNTDKNGNGADGILDTNIDAQMLLQTAVANNKLIGSADTYSEALSANAANTVPYTFDETEITEGEYYLLFSITGNHPNATAYQTAYTGYYAYISSLSFKKVGEVENVEAPTVALAVDYGTGDPTVISYPRGKEITVTAPDKTDENLTFRHWVRGTADGGDWITNDATYSFTLATNTYLTAVYTATTAETDKIVEFWGGNGEYLTEAKADADGEVTFPENPKMTGFKFLQWIVAKNTPVTADTVFEDTITRVVADFVDDEAVQFEVDGTNYVYDAKVHKDADKEKAWYRDNVLVGYGETYDYHVWDAVGSIEARDISGEKAPVVVLDDTIKEEKACMIEYDTAGKDVTEVGIVFGTSSATIDSCNSKATSQKKLSHGQFTAKPNKNGNATHARGYIIYNDAGVYRVTYTNPVALNS